MDEIPFKPITARNRTSSSTLASSTPSNPKNVTQDLTPTRFFVGHQFDTKNQNMVRVEIDSKFGKKSSAQYVHPQFARIQRSHDYCEDDRLKENRRRLIEKYGKDFVNKGWNLREIMENQNLDEISVSEEDSDDNVKQKAKIHKNALLELGIPRNKQPFRSPEKKLQILERSKEIMDKIFTEGDCNCSGELVQKIEPMNPLQKKRRKKGQKNSIFPTQDLNELPFFRTQSELKDDNGESKGTIITHTTWKGRQAIRDLETAEKGEGDKPDNPVKDNSFVVVKTMRKAHQRFCKRYESDEELSDHPDPTPPSPPPGLLKTKPAWGTSSSSSDYDGGPITDNRVHRIRRKHLDKVEEPTLDLAQVALSNHDVTSEASGHVDHQLHENERDSDESTEPSHHSDSDSDGTEFKDSARKYAATRLTSKTDTDFNKVSKDNSATSFSIKLDSSVSSMASTTSTSVDTKTTCSATSTVSKSKSDAKIKTDGSDSDTSNVEGDVPVAAIGIANGDMPIHMNLNPQDYSEILAFFAAKNLSTLELGRCTDNPPLMNKFYKTTTTLGMPDWNLDRAAILDNLEEFIKLPVAIGFLIKCRVFRDRRGVDRGMFPTYVMHLENEKCRNTLLMTARKRKKSATSNYLISIDPLTLIRDEDAVVGKVRGNLVGTQFTIYDGGKSPTKCEIGMSRPREELAAIFYYPNLLGFKGPRKMRFFVPAMISETKRFERYPDGEHESILVNAKKGLNHGLLELRNKPPIFNNDAHSFVLNFQGRVTEASVKNFQIIHPDREDYTILQFGRVNKDTFALDIKYPLCPLQAFGIVLSSFTSKLAVE